MSLPAPPDPARVLASMAPAALVLAPGGVVAQANPSAEQLFGQSARRLQGRGLDSLLQLGSTRLSERLADPEALVSARQVEVRIAGRGARRLDVTAAPLVDHPGWQVVTLLDAATAEAVSEVAAGGDDAVLRAPDVLAHEIKNPLAGIRGAAQLLARKAGPGEVPLTTLIADEVDRIAKLIDQMQTLSRRTVEPVAPCNLHEAIRRAAAVLAAGNPDAVRIEEHFDPSLPPVLGNAGALVQVLINLIANAREACAAGAGPRVVVRTRFASGLQLHAPGQGTPLRLPIEVRVSDNGPGVDPALRDHLFEPFVTSKRSGQGLGLALVRKLVSEMTGRITNDREDGSEGGWTHFRIHLPMATRADLAAQGAGE